MDSTKTTFVSPPKPAHAHVFTPLALHSVNGTLKLLVACVCGHFEHRDATSTDEVATAK